MKQKKSFGILLWLLVCLSGSLTYGIVLNIWMNSSDVFYMDTSSTMGIILALFVLSAVISSPILVYIASREKNNPNLQSRVAEYILAYTAFFSGLYLFLSYAMGSFIEGIELMTTYFIAGLIALNVYLRKQN